jgi:hypothetical protein
VAKNILLYGPSGSCKTSLLGTFITGMHRELKKKARMYNVDGGVDTIRYHIDNGLLSVCEMLNRPFPFESLLDASQGSWPESLTDPTSLMIPAFLNRYVAKCEACNHATYDQDKPCTTTHVKCTKCQADIAVRPRRAFNPKNNLEDVGVICYEGVTGFSERLLDDQANRAAKGEKTGGDVAVRFTDGNLMIGSNTQSSYGVAQRRLKDAVEKSRLLPVEYVIWTAHKDRGTDDMKRVPVFGPKLAGHAATDDAPRWFGQCFPVTNYPVKGGIEKRIYVASYYEDWNPIVKDVEHLANSRVPPHVLKGMPQFYVFDAERKGQFGGETLLWDLVREIERRQAEAGKQALVGA